jgi:tetratricopeptide (TPR) repeat protein
MPEVEKPAVRVNLRAILLAVVVICLGLIVFSKFRPKPGWVAASIPPIMRGPLKPLTPPLTANRLELLSDLRARRFDALDAKLKGYEEQAERDVTQEANARLALEAFDNSDQGLDPLLEQWVKRSPGSYSAHLAWATLLFTRGGEARGDKWASQTTEQQFARMRAFFVQGAREARAALALNPKLAWAYGLLLEQQKGEAGPGACLQAGQSALRQIPASYEIRARVMSCLEPRWGGSYRAMDWFAHEAQSFAHQNPRLVALKGLADFDRADRLSANSQYVPAIVLLTHVIAVDGDHAAFYRARGDAFNSMERYADAIEDLRRADQLWPQYPPTLELLANVMLRAGKYQDGLNAINLAIQIGGPRPDDEQLRTSLLMQLQRTSQAKAAAGGD